MQFVAEKPRLNEMANMYRSIGRTVRLEPVLAEEKDKEDGCGKFRICFEGRPEERYMVIICQATTKKI